MGGGDSCARLHTAVTPHRATPRPLRSSLPLTATPHEQAIKAAPGDTTKLIFFRGPTMFLYGPTKPDEEWYKSNLL